MPPCYVSELVILDTEPDVFRITSATLRIFHEFSCLLFRRRISPPVDVLHSTSGNLLSTGGRWIEVTVLSVREDAAISSSFSSLLHMMTKDSKPGVKGLKQRKKPWRKVYIGKKKRKKRPESKE